MADFIPSSEGGLYTWLTNFSTKLTTLGAGLGRTPAQITAMQAKCATIKGRIDAKVAARTAARAATATCNTGNAADLNSLRADIGSIKTDPGYDDPKGQELGVVGSASVFDPTTYKAEITGTRIIMPSQVEVSFSKSAGEIDGVNVYMRLQGASDWTFLARDTNSPYTDATPLAVAGKPEVREYRIRAVIDDEEIGDYSDTVQVTVS